MTLRALRLMPWIGIVLLFVCVHVCAADSSASGLSDQDYAARLSELEAKFAEQQEINRQQEAELVELRKATGDDWLTQRRAQQIQSLVADVLADADTRASALQNGGIQAGWDDQDGFFLSDTNGRFLLNITGQSQTRFVFSWHDQPDTYRSGFENTRTKLGFGGYLYSPDITYQILTNLSRGGGAATLHDAWLRWHFDDEWSVRAGQFKLPFNREFLVDSSRQVAVERSLNNEWSNLGRSQGVEIAYESKLWSFRGALSDGGTDNLAGTGSIVGTDPANTPALNADVEFAAITARGEFLMAGSWDQFKDFTSPKGDQFGMLIGAAAHYQHEEFDGAGIPFIRNERRWWAYTVDMSVEWGGANLFVSFVHHNADNPNFGIFNIYGAIGQFGWYISPKVELFTRFEWAQFGLESQSFPDLYTATFGTNYYIQGHDLKLTADIGFGIEEIPPVWSSDLAGWRTDGPGNAPQIVIRTQLQFLF